MKRILKKTVKFLFLTLFICFVIYVWKFLPILCGHVAKEMCSAIFITGRTPADIAKHETGIFPYNLASYTVNWKDSSVTASVLGLAKRKAIFRKGLGATLISGISEGALRNQAIALPAGLPAGQDSSRFPRGILYPTA
ncbi:MAG: hypothetical protein U0X40_07355 [Ferruginibacter sp.]